MSGSALVITSPSSSRMRRNTPCVAGCDGPMLIVSFSPTRSSVLCWYASAAFAALLAVSGGFVVLERICHAANSEAAVLRTASILLGLSIDTLNTTRKRYL